MALPAINIKVQSDADAAVKGLDRVDGALGRVGKQSIVTGSAAASMSSRLSAVTANSRQLRGVIQNTSFQLQDMAVQLSMGTRASTVLAQQLPQLASGFGAVGAIVGVVAAVGIPALAYAFGEASDEADRLSEALKNIAESTEEADDAYQVYIRGLRSSNELRILEEIARIETQINEIRNDSDKRAARGRAKRIADREAEIARLRELIRVNRENEDRLEASRVKTKEILDLVRDLPGAFTAVGGPIDQITQKASIFAGHIQGALEAIRQFDANERLSTQNLRDSKTYSGRGGDPRAFMRGGYASPANLPTAPVVGGGGGVGNDGRLEALMESLQTERETVQQWYNESLEILNTANESELEAIGGHNEARLRLEQEYQDRLRGLRSGYNGDALSQASTFFGEMAAAARSGGEKTLQAAKVFGAAQALINSYVAYTEVLKDPLLPWFARIPAAVGVLSAGLGMVNAIKGTGAGANSAGAPTVGAATSEQSFSRNVTIELQGEQYSRSSVMGLINSINEAVEDGAVIRLA
jgi:hypothetical protein